MHPDFHWGAQQLPRGAPTVHVCACAWALPCRCHKKCSCQVGIEPQEMILDSRHLHLQNRVVQVEIATFSFPYVFVFHQQCLVLPATSLKQQHCALICSALPVCLPAGCCVNVLSGEKGIDVMLSLIR